MRRTILMLMAAVVTALAIPTVVSAQPSVAKGLQATLKIPTMLMGQSRGMGGRYSVVTVSVDENGTVVGSRPDWDTVVPSELVEHTVIKVSGWKKPKTKKGVQHPGYTEVSLLRQNDREIVRLRFQDLREGPELDRAFWEVAFFGTVSPDQAREYIEKVQATSRIRKEAPEPAARVRSELKSKYFTTSDGVRLHYLDAGAGPAIILVPGWAMPAEIWSKQMEALSTDHRVVALDPRSQGRSDVAGEGMYPGRRAQDIAELVRHLNGSPVALVGWSLAVQELLAYVAEYGTESLTALVFVDGPVTTNGERIQTTRRRILHEIQRDRKNLTERFIRGMFRTPQEEAYIQNLVEASLKTPTSSAFTLMGEYLVMERDLSEALTKVRCPLLYAVTPGLEEEAVAVAERVPGTRVEVFQDAGHALFVDQADRFSDLLRSFLAGN
jgi:non-heme chloroperoxidase